MHMQRITRRQPAKAQSIEILLDLVAQVLGLVQSSIRTSGDVTGFKEDKNQQT